MQVNLTCGPGHVNEVQCVAAVVSFISPFVSDSVLFSFFILSPPLSTGSSGIRLFFANLERSQSRPNVHSQTPKIYASIFSAQAYGPRDFSLSFDTLVW